MKRLLVALFLVVAIHNNTHAFIDVIWDYFSNIQVRSKDHVEQEAPAWFFQAPQNVDYTVLDDEIFITWDAPEYAEPQGYNVLAKTTDTSSYVQQNKELLTTTTFSLNVSKGNEYNIYVVAVYANQQAKSDLLVINVKNDSSSIANQQSEPANENLIQIVKNYQVTDYNSSLIQVNDTINLANEGEPVLPVGSVKVLIPANKQIDKVTTTYKKRMLQDTFEIEYQREMYPTAQDPKLPTIQPAQKNLTIYSSDTAYPANRINHFSTQTYHGHSIAMITTHPVIYYPQSGKVELAYEMTINVHLKDAPRTLGIQNLRRQPDDLDAIKRIVDNPSDLNSYKSVTKAFQTSALSQNDYIYVIITNASLAPYYQALIDHRTAKNITSTIKTTEEIYAEYSGKDNPEKIRNFIKDAYNNWGTQYVLLGGDIQIIPQRYAYAQYSSQTDSQMLTDLYYACLDGDWDANQNGVYGETGEADLYAEVYIGRQPADNATHVQNFVNKVIAFENMNRTDPALKRAMLVGEKMDSRTWGGNSMDHLVDELTPTFSVSKFYDRDMSWDKYKIAQWANGTGYQFIFHMGHSSPASNMKFNVSSVRDLYTNNKYFIMYSQGCYPASFDNLWWNPYRWTYNSGDAIGETYVNSEHAAVAFIGYTRYGWYSVGGSFGSSTRYQDSFAKEVFVRGTKQLGKAVQGHKEYLKDYNNYYQLWHYYSITLLGDPLLQMHNDLQAGLFTELQPINNDWIASEVTLKANVENGEGIHNKVEFQYSTDNSNWNTINTDTNQPWEYIWDTSAINATKVYLRVKAYTNLNESATSLVVEKNIDNQAPTTVFNGSTGWFNEPQSVELSLSDIGSGIDKTYYTLDGTEPNDSSKVYTDQIYLNKTGSYDIKFFSVDKVGNAQAVQTIDTIVINSDIQTGWPYTTNGAIYGAPTLADIDNDSEDEIIFGSQDGKVHVVKADGTNVFGWPQDGFSGGASGASVGDIDGDGDMEIVIGGAYSGILAFHHNGLPVSGFPVLNTLNIPFNGTPALADINHDRKLDIIVSAGNKLYVYNHLGQVFNGFPKTIGTSNEDVFSSPSVADIDGNGNLEIFIGSRGVNSSVYAFHHDGSAVEGFPVATDSDWIMTSPLIANLDSDIQPEIIIAGGQSKKLFVLNADGTEQFTYEADGYFLTTPALADINNDNQLEILVANVSGQESKLLTLDGQGNVLNTITTTFNISSSPVVGDINGDNQQDIIFGSDNNQFYAYNQDGSLLNGFPKAIEGTISLSPALGDINGDNNVDIIVASWDGNLYVFNTNSALTKNEWPQFKNNVHHTGVYPTIKVKKDEGTRIGKNIDLKVDTFGNQHAVTYEYSKDGVNFTTIGTSTEYPYDLVWDCDIADYEGDLYIRSFMTDENNRRSLPNTVKVQLDTKAPTLTVFGASDKANDNGGSVVVNWAATADDLQEYRLYRSTEASSAEPNLASPIYTGMNTSFTDTGLTNGTTYYYTIVASDGLNDKISGEKAVAPVDNIAPSAITDLSVGDKPNDQGGYVNITWSHSDVRNYKLYRSSNQVDWTLIAEQTDNSYTDNVDSHYYKVTATDGTNTTESNVAGNVTSLDNIAPQEVTNLHQTSTGENTLYVKIAWINPDDSDITQILIKKNNTTIATLANNASFYVDYDVVKGTAYFYKVVLDDGTFQTETGNNFGYVDDIAPAAITNLQVADKANDQGGSLDISFTLSTDDATDVNQYAINISANKEDVVKQVLLNAGVSNKEITGLNPLVEYYVQVLAIDEVGNRTLPAWSNGVQPIDNIAPNAITNLQVQDVANDQGNALQLSWTASTSTDITKYLVYRDGNLIGETASTSYVDSVVKNTEYAYKVVAKDTMNFSPDSSIVKGSGIDNVPPTVLNSFTVADNPNDQGNALLISWSKNNDADVTAYKLYKDDVLIQSLSKDTTSFVDSVSESHTYYIEMTDGKYTVKTEALSASPVDDFISDFSQFSVSDVADDQGTQLLIQWNHPDTDLNAFKVYRNTTLIKTTTASSFTDTGLNRDESYTYYVSVVDDANNQKQTVQITKQPIDNIAPATIANLQIADVQNDHGTALALSWDSVSDSDFQHYIVYQAGNVITTTNQTSLTVNELKAKNSYAFEVSAFDGYNEGVKTSKVASPIDNIPPVAITDLTAIDYKYDDGNQIVLNWTLNTDPITNYTIQKSTDQITWTMIPINLVNTITLTVDENSTNYFFRILTTDGTYSVTSNTVVAQAINDRPNAPTNVIVTDIPNDQGEAVKLTFNGVSGISSYTIFRSVDDVTYEELATITTTVYTDSSVAYGRVYYKVRSNTEHINSFLSEAGYGNPVDNINPELPINITLQDIPNDNGEGVVLSFQPSISDDIKHYEIYKSNELVQSTQLTTITIAGTVGEAVSIKVKAVDIHGNKSDFSAGVTTWIQDNKVEPVTDFEAKDTPNDKGGSISLTWKKSVEDGEGNDNVQSYAIYRKTTTDWNLLSTLDKGNTSYTDTTVQDNLGYQYKIITKDTFNNTVETVSNIAVAKNNYTGQDDNNDPKVEFPKSVNLIATDVPNDQGSALKISLTNSYQVAYAYSLQKSTDKTVFNDIHTTNTAPFDFTDSNLEKQVYYYRLVISKDGESWTSPAIEAKPVDNIPASKPTNVIAKDVVADNGGKISISWDQVNDSDLIGYAVYRSTNQINWREIQSTIETSYIDSVENKVSYFYQVASFDGDNYNGTTTNAVEAIDNLAPSKVTNLIAQDVAGDRGGKIALSWTKSVSNDVTGQSLYRKIETGSYELYKTFDASTQAFEDTVTTNLNAYYYIVVTDGTNTTYGDAVGPVQAKHNYPKSAPATELKVSDVADDQGGVLTISWKHSADFNAGYSDVLGYNLYRNNQYLTFVTGNSYVDVVDNATTQNYFVKAKNAFVESDATTVMSAKSLDNIAPELPANVQVNDMADTSGKLVVTWTKSTSSDVLGHNVYMNGSLLRTMGKADELLNVSVDDFENVTFVVSAFDQDNEVKTQAVSGMSYPDHAYNAGYHLVSVPFNTDDSSNYVYRAPEAAWTWNGESYERAADITSGMGQIVKLNKDIRTKFSSASYNELEPFEIELNDYWTLVGNPFNFEVALSSCEFKTATASYTYGQAVDAGMIQNVVWGYSNDEWTHPTSLKPWEAIWILSFERGLKMVVNPVEASAKIQTSSIAGEKIQITLIADGKVVDRANYIGRSEFANNEYDKLDVIEAPQFKTFTRLYFTDKKKVQTLATDMRNSVDDVQVFHAVVESSESHSKYEIKVSGIGEDESLYVVKNGKKFEVKNGDVITVGEVFELQLVAFNSQKMTIESLYNYPNPFNPNKENTTFSFEVPNNATGTMTIYSIVGIQVGEFDVNATAGLNTIEWNGKDMDGNTLANGAYFYLLQLTDADGTKVRSTQKLVVWK